MTVTNAGADYTTPAVSFTGGGATTQATAIAYGHLNAITLTGGGSGYTVPTVDFDMPDDPNGVQATAHVDMDANGTSQRRHGQARLGLLGRAEHGHP